MECSYPVPQKRVSRLARERQLLEKNKKLEREMLRLSSESRSTTVIGPGAAATGPTNDRAAPATLDSGYFPSPETSQDRGNTNSAITVELAGEVQDSVEEDLLRRIQLSTLTTNSTLDILSPQSIASNEESVVSPQHVSAYLSNEIEF